MPDSASEVSVAVMSHPRRNHEASLLAERLEGARVVCDPEPGEDPSPLKTSLHAWRAVEPGATHHLVVQDDIDLSDGFLRRVRAGVQLFPDSAIAFYCNWNSANGAAVRLAAAAGATWAEETGAEYFPTLAMVLPSRHIDAYLEFAAPFAGLWRDDDEVVREFLVSRGIGAVLSVPSLVQHGHLPSLAGNAAHGIRRAACFSPRVAHDEAREAVAHSIAQIPWLKAGRVLSMVRSGAQPHSGAQPDYLRRPWTEMLAPLRLDAADLRGRFGKLTVRDARLDKARTDLGDLFVYSLWLASYLMGAITGNDAVPVRVLAEGSPDAGGLMARAGLDTLAAGASIGTVIPADLVEAYRPELAALTENGFAGGLAGR
jgi:hypothetical protein